MGKPTAEELSDQAVKAGVRAAKENFALHTDVVLTAEQQDLIRVGVMFGATAMAELLLANGARWD